MRSALGPSPVDAGGDRRRRRLAGRMQTGGAEMPIAPPNLLGLVRSCLDESALGRLARCLRLAPPQARQAVDAVLPPLLVGLVGMAARCPAHDSRVAAAFEGIEESLLERLDAALSDTGIPLTRRLGRRALRGLFGEAAAARLVSRAARYAQLDPAAARALLEVLAPIALAAAQRLMRSRGVGPDGLVGLMAVEPPAPQVVRSERPPLRLESWPASLGVVLALAWSLLLGYWAWSVPVPAGHLAAADGSAASTLSLSHIGIQIEYSGVVDDERSRTSALEVLSGIFGEGNLVGDLRVDSRVAPPPWLEPLRLVLLATRKPGVELLLAGSRIDVAAERLGASAAMVHRLRALIGDRFAVGLRQPQLGPAALAALATGSPSEDLLTLLGAWVIRFPPDSDEFPAAHRPVIRRVARLMDALPDGATVEVIGHTDDTGDAAVNLTLSRVRAESVREALIDAGANPSRLRARGYGSACPVARNDRPNGRALNRRIEFLVTDD